MANYLQELLGDAYKEGMTESEISEALEKAHSTADSATETHYKGLISKANSEAADYKKQLRALQSEQERKAADAAEAQKKMEEELQELRKSAAVNATKAKLAENGFGDMAENLATAIYDGDTDTIVKSLTAFSSAKEASVRESIMKEAGTAPAANQQTKTITLKDLRDMSTADRMAFANEHPAEYEALYTQK